MTDMKKITGLSAAALLCIALFLFFDLGSNWGYALPRRGWKIAAIVITGACIAFSTVLFQTVTNNRILTPNIIGLDSMYMLIQTAIVFVFGSTSQLLSNNQVNFLISMAFMMLFAGLLYKWMFKREGSNLYFLMLVGIILGTLLGSLTTFLQVLIDPNEFLVLQGKMFATYNNVKPGLTVLCGLLLLAIALYYTRLSKYMDVLSLGKDHAVNLGVSYDAVVRQLMMLIAAMVSIATALVGPLTFLGLLVVNVTYQLMGTHRHVMLIPASILVSVIALVGGQMIVEHVFTFDTTVSVIINLVGGVYFLYLLLRENKS